MAVERSGGLCQGGKHSEDAWWQQLKERVPLVAGLPDGATFWVCTWTWQPAQTVLRTPPTHWLLWALGCGSRNRNWYFVKS